MQSKPVTALIYIGNGTYIHGVPARDLTADEAKQYSAIISEQEKLTGTVLYQAPPKEAVNG